MVAEIKEYLLEELPFLNTGFVDVFLDGVTGKLISYHGDEVGLSDKNGKFFYIRENGDENYKMNQQRGPMIVGTERNYRIVMYAGDLDTLSVKKCLLTALFVFEKNGRKIITVQSSSTNLGGIVSSEYPKLRDSDRQNVLKSLKFGSLLAVDFKVTDQMIVNKCKCEICAEC